MNEAVISSGGTNGGGVSISAKCCSSTPSPSKEYEVSMWTDKDKAVVVVGGDCEPHVLAVDDNAVDRKLVERLLKASSCKVTTAESGMRALEYLGLGDDDHQGSSTRQVSLILTDYCMPGMTGYDLLKKIKESTHMREVPVVIMSSENVPARIDRCLAEGAQMFILKPLKLSDVEKLRLQFMHRTT